MKWRLVPLAARSGAWNMAIDETLLVVCGKNRQPVLRFYTWEPPAVTIGRHQRMQNAVSLEACRKNNIEVIRRITGGRAVLHHHELTYCVIVPEEHLPQPVTVAQSYKLIADCLVKGLRRFGINAEATLPETMIGRKNSSVTSCFETLSVYEINIGGKKLAGSAQARKNGIILQHGSLLLDMDIELYMLLFGKMKENRFTTLYQELGYLPDVQELCSKMVEGFRENMNMSLIIDDLHPAEEEEAYFLTLNKYTSAIWNEKQ